MPTQLDLRKGFRHLAVAKTLPPSKLAKSGEYRDYQRKSIRIHDNRHPNIESLPTVTLPIQLFHPVFGFFSSKAFNPGYEVPVEILCLTQKLMHQAASIYPDEGVRKSEMRPLLEVILGYRIVNESNQDKTQPDGVVICSKLRFRSLLLIIEEKCELGDGSSDPATQVEFSYLRAYQQSEVHYSISRILASLMLNV